jgi:hypothetical protein
LHGSHGYSSFTTREWAECLPGCVMAVQVAHQYRIALVRCGQGWTGPLGPRSRRIDCMIANVVVLV